LHHWRLFLAGHAEYYPRFGFTNAGLKGFKCEYEAPEKAWVVLESNDDVSLPKGGTTYFNQQFKYVV
jgi:putative acetyltransferase